MLLASPVGLPILIMSHLFLIPYTGSQLEKKKKKKRGGGGGGWFKVLSLCLKSQNDSGPQCISVLTLCTFPTASVFFSHVFLKKNVNLSPPWNFGQRFFSYQGPSVYLESLPLTIRHAKSFQSFKSYLKTFLFSWFFSSLYEEVGGGGEGGIRPWKRKASSSKHPA